MQPPRNASATGAFARRKITRFPQTLDFFPQTVRADTTDWCGFRVSFSLAAVVVGFFCNVECSIFPCGRCSAAVRCRGVRSFFCADCRFCGFPLFSLWKITFGKVAPAYACYFFYAILSLGKLRFPRKKLGEGLPLLRLSLALLVENHIFGKVAPAYACYFFYAIFSLGKLRFPRKKLGEGLPLCGFPLLSLWKITFSEKLRPLTRATFFMQFFP